MESTSNIFIAIPGTTQTTPTTIEYGTEKVTALKNVDAPVNEDNLIEHDDLANPTLKYRPIFGRRKDYDNLLDIDNILLGKAGRQETYPGSSTTTLGTACRLTTTTICSYTTRGSGDIWIFDEAETE